MKNKFKMMLLAMATLGFFSCSDKLAEEGTPSDPSGSKTEGFVSFKINNVGSGMRAATSGSYTAGEKNEYAITTEQGANVVFFFDDKDGFFGKSYLTLMSDEATDSKDGHDDDNEKVYSARIRKSKETGENLASCVLILNADPAKLEALSVESWTDLQTALDTDLGQHGEYFTMSNTIYVDTDVKGPEKIEKENICDTWGEAQENPVRVHVERVVAKFGLSFIKDREASSPEAVLDNNQSVVFEDEDKQQPLIKYTAATTDEDKEKFEDGTTEKWAIRIKGWNVNATETETYYLKNLGNDEDGKLTSSNFGKWGANNSLGWNDANKVRSYWAVDPHYNSGVFPEQYRTANNTAPNETIETGISAGVGTNNSTSALKYISYNQIGTNFDAPAYAPENTFGGDLGFIEKLTGDETYEFKGEGYKRAGTHILIAAELLFDDEVEGTGPVGDKYCYEGQYWTDEYAGENQVNLIKYMVNSLIDTFGSTLYLKGDDDQYIPQTLDELAPLFQLTIATIKGGDGRKMLELDKSKNITLYKKTGTDASGKDTYADAGTDLQKAIYEVGTVKHFKEGKMYYAVPIEHMNANVTNTTDNIHRWLTGSYGVVRNHWYKVNIKSLSKPGTSVDDPGQPIIPNDEPEEGEYIAFEIVVVPWHVIEQDVDF